MIVVFDEHGGCYDHVPPPTAASPSRSPTSRSISTVTVSAFRTSNFPYIPRVGAAPEGSDPSTIHDSRTLRKRFALGPPLSERDAVAPTIEAALTLPQPTNLGPDRIDAPQPEPRIAGREVGIDEPLTDLQASLVELARALPDPGQEDDHIRRLEVAPPRAVATQGLSPAEAGAVVDTHVRRFLGES